MVIEVFDDNGRSTDAVMGRAVLSIPPPDGEWGEMELQLEPQGTIHLNVTCIDEASERRRLNAQNNRTYAMLRADRVSAKVAKVYQEQRVLSRRPSELDDGR